MLKFTKKKILEVTSNLDTFYRLASSCRQSYENGNNWYNSYYAAYKKLAYNRKIEIEKVASIASILSTNVHWKIAHRKVYEFFSQAQFNRIKIMSSKQFEKIESILALHSNENFNLSDTFIIDNILHGNKITSFYRNLLLSKDHVTIDRHMIRIFLNLSKNTSNVRLAMQLIQNNTSYNHLANILLDYAAKQNLVPYKVQATAWDFYTSHMKNDQLQYCFDCKY